MDPLTHALTSYTLKRAAFPRANRRLTIAIVLTGSIASLDRLSAHISPSAYLTYYRNGSSSLLLALLLALAFSIPFFLRSSASQPSSPTPARAFSAILLSALLHPFMDVLQAEPTALLWPFSSRRLQLDWLPHLDIWIFGILIAAFLLSALFRLVSSEIGAKSKSPKGQAGAIAALCAIVLYIGLRAVMHGNAIAAIEARTYRGEAPKKVSALPNANSPFTWQGVFETQTALHDVPVLVGPFAEYDPESISYSFKPEPSPTLSAATQTSAAQRFLVVARFPKATVEPLTTGFQVTLRDFPPNRGSRTARRVQAVITTGPAGNIRSDEIVWDPASQDNTEE